MPQHEYEDETEEFAEQVKQLVKRGLLTNAERLNAPAFQPEDSKEVIL